MSIVKFLKSFDIFNSEAKRFLTDKALSIFFIENKSDKTGSVGIATDKKSINIHVVNRPKTYQLLISAKKRIEEKREKEKQLAKL